MNQIASNIVLIRKKKRISQKEIADEYGIDQNGMSRLERGERKVEAELLVYLSKKFEMGIDEIVNYHLTDEIQVPESNIIREEKVDYEKSPNQIQVLIREKNQLLKDREYYNTMMQTSTYRINSLEKENAELKEELKRCREK